MLLAQYKPPLRKYVVTSVQQLAKLANISAHCEYFVKYECFDSQLLSGPVSIGYVHDWWVSRDGKAMTYWGGWNYTSYMHACGLNRSRADPRYGCNFDINDYVSRESRELLTTTAELPVIQLRFGDTGEAGDYERGNTPLKLMCYGIN